ncbi:MAG: PEP-CTERM sorting domain-containing protein [Gemmatimonadaceae bacterium]
MKSISLRMSALTALLTLGATSAAAQGGLMQLVAVGAQNLYITPTTVANNFAGAPAPCSFGAASPLTNQLSGTGLTFSGTGAVLNSCANVIPTLTAPENNFLAYQATSTPVTERINFTTEQSSLLFSIAGTQGVSIQAFMNESLVAEGSFGLGDAEGWSSIAVYNAPFNRVVVSAGGDMNGWALDDLYSTSATTVPEPATFAMLAFGLCAISMGVRLRKQFRG